jgi:hypothetical protein
VEQNPYAAPTAAKERQRSAVRPYPIPGCFYIGVLLIVILVFAWFMGIYFVA